MFSGEGGREAGGQVPASVIEYLEKKGYKYRVERGTEIVVVVILGVADAKVWPTKKRILGLLEAAEAAENVSLLFM